MNDGDPTGLTPFHAMEILARAKALEAAGRSICHLELGEPSAPPAPGVLAAVAKVLPAGQPYTHAKGLIDLRQALAAYYRRQHGAEVDPESIVVTTGSSAAFILAFLAAFGRGGTVAVTRPGYPAYRNTLSGLGLDSVEIELAAANGWRLTAADVEAAYARAPFEGLLFASPANPTGAAVTREGLEAIVATCLRLGVRLISDEIYHGLDYGEPSASALEFGRDAIVVNSFSKYYCMTGWRVGWMVVPEALVRPIERLQQNLAISVPTLSQLAAEAAFDGRDEMEAVKRGYVENRRILIEGLPKAGLSKFLPADGAFYLYADVSDFTTDSFAFAKQMLEEAHVAATPGVDFDPVHGHNFIRFSYARSADDMREAVARIARWLG